MQWCVWLLYSSFPISHVLIPASSPPPPKAARLLVLGFCGGTFPLLPTDITLCLSTVTWREIVMFVPHLTYNIQFLLNKFKNLSMRNLLRKWGSPSFSMLIQKMLIIRIFVLRAIATCKKTSSILFYFIYCIYWLVSSSSTANIF